MNVEDCDTFLQRLHISLRPSSSWNAADAIAVFYSLVPWVGALFLVVGSSVIAVRTRRGRRPRTARESSMLWGFALLTSMIVVSEHVLKKLAQQPRPDGSCLTSHGMPSSHSVLAFGFLTFVGLEWVSFVGDTVTRWELTALVGLLLPVPLARVHLEDHTIEQAVVGCFVGCGLAACFHLLTTPRRRRRRKGTRTPVSCGDPTS